MPCSAPPVTSPHRSPFFILAAVPPALAQDAQEEPGAEGGFSAYAVARVKVLDGSVWVRPSGGGDWEEFSSNSPIPRAAA